MRDDIQPIIVSQMGLFLCAHACPILPIPMIPIVLWCTSNPFIRQGNTPLNFPPLIYASDSGNLQIALKNTLITNSMHKKINLLAAPRSNAKVKSAHVSVRTPGVLETGMPSALAAATLMLSKPTA